MLFKSVKLISEGRTSMILSRCSLDNVADIFSCNSLHYWEICYCLYPLNSSLKEAPRWSFLTAVLITCFIIINQLVRWDPPVNYAEILQSTTTLSAGDKDQLSIQGFQHHGTSCLELSVSSYIRKVPLSSLLSTHIWKLNCSLLHTTQSNISSAGDAPDLKSSTYGAAYRCFDVDIDGYLIF